MKQEWQKSPALGPGKQKVLGLVWRNRRKICQIINAYIYLPFFLLIIWWPWSYLWGSLPPVNSVNIMRTTIKQQTAQERIKKNKIIMNIEQLKKSICSKTLVSLYKNFQPEAMLNFMLWCWKNKSFTRVTKKQYFRPSCAVLSVAAIS